MTATLYYSNTTPQYLGNVIMDSDITGWDALIAWRDDLLEKDILRKSKVDYLSNMTKLIERGLVNPQQPLFEFIREESKKNNIHKIEALLDWPLSTKRSRLTLFRSFHSFSQQQNIIKTPIERPIEMFSISELLSSNEDKAKSQYLKKEEMNIFLHELFNINKRDFLICRMMWELKCTIHQILNMKVGDYDQAKGIFKINKFEGRFGNLRNDIKEPILKLCENKKTTDFIFCTDKGNSIHPAQIDSTKHETSQQARKPTCYY